MDQISKMIKTSMAIDLEKNGSSLEQLEDALSKGDIKYASEQLAKFGSDALEKIVSGLGTGIANIPEALLALSVLGGTAVGGTAFGINKHLNNQDNRFADKQQQNDKLRGITGQLKQDYNL